MLSGADNFIALEPFVEFSNNSIYPAEKIPLLTFNALSHWVNASNLILPVPVVSISISLFDTKFLTSKCPLLCPISPICVSSNWWSITRQSKKFALLVVAFILISPFLNSGVSRKSLFSKLLTLSAVIYNAPFVNWLLLVGIWLNNANVPVVDGVVITAVETLPIKELIVLFVNVSVEFALIYNAPFVNWLLFVGIWLVNANVPANDGVVIFAKLPPVKEVIVLLLNVSVEFAVIYNAPFVNWLLFVGIWLNNANVPAVVGKNKVAFAPTLSGHCILNLLFPLLVFSKKSIKPPDVFSLKTWKGRNETDASIFVGLIFNLSLPCVLNIIPFVVKLLFKIKSSWSVVDAGTPNPILAWTASFSFVNKIWQFLVSSPALSSSLLKINLQDPFAFPPEVKR